MEEKTQITTKTKDRGHFCVAPGCINTHYSARVKHFHGFPVIKPKLFRKWLHGIRRREDDMNATIL